MSKYLKLFGIHTDYEEYMNGGGIALPNVSLCKQENEVHYNHVVVPDEPVLEGNKVLCKYNVTDTSSPINLYYYEKSGSGSGSGSEDTPMFSSMIVDSVEQEVTSTYTFDTVGEHTVLFTLAEGVTSIGDYAFIYCDKLTNVIIGNSVTSIGESAFQQCYGLTSINIGNGVTSIGHQAFYKCNGLTSITIPDLVTSIGSSAFGGCSGLTSVIIPNSVTSIGDSAFYDCSGLTSITIGNSVTSIPDDTFIYCSNITNININSGNTVYDSRNNCNAIIETSTNKLVHGCKTTIIPDSVTSIGNTAFYYCSGLTSVTIPDSVTSIGSNAFNYSSGLTRITSLATSAPTISSSTFYEVKTGGILYVSSGATGYDNWINKLNGWTKVEQ